jgi:hypothetical protein
MWVNAKIWSRTESSLTRLTATSFSLDHIKLTRGRVGLNLCDGRLVKNLPLPSHALQTSLKGASAHLHAAMSELYVTTFGAIPIARI